MRKDVALFLLVLSIACTREEFLRDVSDPEPVYTRIREAFDRKADSISQLSCLGELTFDGGPRVYVTLEQGSDQGIAHFYSPTRQELGWVRFGEGPPTWSFDEVPEIGGLLESGLFTGLTAIGHPPLPEDVGHLKMGESSKFFYIRAGHGDLSYGYKILKRPLALLTLVVEEQGSSIEIEFRNHHRRDSFLFPYRLVGSTSFGDFELVYLEIKHAVNSIP